MKLGYIWNEGFLKLFCGGSLRDMKSLDLELKRLSSEHLHLVDFAQLEEG